MENMTERLTHNIYKIVSVGLFSSHQLTFSFLMCASIMRANVPLNEDIAASPIAKTPINTEQEKEANSVKVDAF